MPSITHVTGVHRRRQAGGRQTAPPLPEAHSKGSQTHAARDQVAQAYLWSGATLPQCVCAEGKGQEAVTGQKLLPKGDKEGVIIHSQNNTHSFWPGAPWPTFVMSGGVGPCIDPTCHGFSS